MQTMNINAVIQQIIQGVLQNIPLGPLVSQMIGVPAANWLSPPGSMSNRFIWPGAGSTLTQAGFNYIDNIYSNSFGGSAAQQLSEAADLRIHKAYHKMLNPKLSDEEILGLAENSMGNMFSIPSLVRQFADPYGMTAGMAAARSLASTLQQRGASFSLRGAEYASQINSAIFDSKSGIINDIIADPSRYGNMNVSDVMAIGRELALSEPQGFRALDGKFDSSRFKRRLEEVSRSLEPWKDIFGKDVPKILNQLEALTGQSINSYSGDLSEAGHRMTSVLGATGARIQHLAAYKDALASGMVNMDFSNRAILGSHSVAQGMLLGLSNMSVHTMTNSELQQLGGMYYTGTAKSTMADRYALAYAAWHNTGDGSGTLEKFREAYDREIASGKSPHEALLSLTGSKDISDLEAYRYSKNYVAAIQGGAGAEAARDSLTAQGLAKARSLYTSQRYANYNSQADAYIKGMSDEELKSFMAMTIDDKRKAILDAGITSNNDHAQRIAADLSAAFGSGMSISMGGYIDPEKARVILNQAINEERQGKRAKEIQTIRTTIASMSRRGGIAGIIDAINKKKGEGITPTEAIKGYTGGVDVLDALFSTIMGDKSNISEEDEITYRQGLNFAMNNYGVLASDYKDIYKMMMSKSPDEMKKGYRLAAELNGLGQAALGKLTSEERAAMINTLKNTKLSADQDDYGDVARNLYIDTRVGNALTKVQTEGKIEDKTSVAKMVELLKQDHASVEELKKAAKEAGINEKDVNTIISAAKIGDIDGIDPMHKIAASIENIHKVAVEFAKKYLNLNL